MMMMIPQSTVPTKAENMVPIVVYSASRKMHMMKRDTANITVLAMGPKRQPTKSASENTCGMSRLILPPRKPISRMGRPHAIA